MKCGPIISTHIEKTAGTSLQGFFLSAFSPEEVLIYSASTDTLVRGSFIAQIGLHPLIDRLRGMFGSTPHALIRNYLRWSRSKHIRLHDLPFTDYKVIHGHFKADRFDELLPSNCIRIVVLREPLDRMISHFNYWRRTKGAPTHRVHIPYSPSMNFESYALHPDNINYQAQALSGKSLQDFSLVGVTENMDAFISELHRITSLQPCSPKVGQLNASPQTRQLVSDAFAQVFRQRHNHDYELYQMAQRLTANYSRK